MSITITPEQLKMIDEALIDSETAIGFLAERDRHNWPEHQFSPDHAGDMLAKTAQAKLHAAAEVVEKLQAG